MQGRLAFQLYENEDGSGLTADTRSVLQAFHMCRRVASPMKLSDYLKAEARNVDIPTRLQLYEFFDFLVFQSEKLAIVEQRLQESVDKPCDHNEFISPADALLTREERAEKQLDIKYQQLLFPNIDATKSTITKESIINPGHHNAIVNWGKQEATKLLQPLMLSSTRLNFSRVSGYPRPCSVAMSTKSKIPTGSDSRQQDTALQSKSDSFVNDMKLQDSSLQSWKSLPLNIVPKWSKRDAFSDPTCQVDTFQQPGRDVSSSTRQDRQLMKHHKVVFPERKAPDSALLVSVNEIEKQKDLIYALEWKTLRKQTLWNTHKDARF